MDAAAIQKVACHRSSTGSKPFPGSPHPSDMLDTTMPAPPAANDAVDEPALVRAAAAGDTAAYERLYRRHAPRVFAVLWRLCGGQQARAEDALQEAFLQAWKALPGFRFESSLSTWLHRLGVNAALMELRGREAPPWSLMVRPLSPWSFLRISYPLYCTVQPLYCTAQT